MVSDDYSPTSLVHSAPSLYNARLVVTEVRSESFGLVTERRHYNARHIFRRVWYRALSPRYAGIRSSGIIISSSPRPTSVPNVVSFVASIAELALAHGEKSHTHLLNNVRIVLLALC